MVAQWFEHLTRNRWMTVMREFKHHQKAFVVSMSKQLHILCSIRHGRYQI